ncbi:Maf-like protein, partial [Hanseniaspora valbyensis NRRL Y-1626]
LIQQYVNSGEGLDAAGGFKIQETGSFMVEKIDGDFYTVVGLPFNSTMMTLIEVINKL